MVSRKSNAEKIRLFDAKMEIARGGLVQMKSNENTFMLINCAGEIFKVQHKQLTRHRGTLLGILLFPF